MRMRHMIWKALTATLILTGALAGSSVKAAEPPPRKPNILFIMADDHATDAISAYGSHLAGVFKTPNLDRLAAQGARLTV